MKEKSELKPKTRTELAAEYGIDRKTLYNWLRRLDLPVKSGLLTSRYLEQIYEVYGKPFSQNNSV